MMGHAFRVLAVGVLVIALGSLIAYALGSAL